MKNILIVDDEIRMRYIYKTLLTLEGYRVVEARGAVDAREVLKRETVDLVLLDVRMPEVRGDILYDVMQLFHQKVKVIVSSVYHTERQKKIIPDATDYYDKSQSVNILLGKIKKVFRDTPQEQVPRQTEEYGDVAPDYVPPSWW